MSDVILVTGASTGLGLAIAKQLLESDAHLILTARESSLGRFEQAGIRESERLWIRRLDVMDASQREDVVAEADALLGGIDVLINNAGISYRSVIEHVDEHERQHQMGVNFRGPMALAALVLPSMRRKRAGRILQISSASGFMAMPTMGAYTASKFALEGATEALYYEARPFGIKVSLILPGFINSQGFENVLYTRQSAMAAVDPTNPYYAHYGYMSSFVGRIMRSTPSTSASVARTVVRTMRARWPKLRVPGTFDMRLLWTLRRLLPQQLYHELLYRMLPGVSEWGANAGAVEPAFER